MNNMFNLDPQIDRLTKSTDPDFIMEQLLIQPTDSSYPPVLHCYNYKEVYRLIDAGESVTDYIDYGSLAAMKSTLDVADNKSLNAELKRYKSILETWG